MNADTYMIAINQFFDNGEWKQHEQYLAERYKG